jgi:hypothetical protein
MAKKKAAKAKTLAARQPSAPLPLPRIHGLPNPLTFRKHPSPWTHDASGKELPAWIRDGSVAYVPMHPPKPARA